MTGSTRAVRLRLVALGALLLMAVVAALLVDVPSAGQLRSRIDDTGWPAAIAFVGAYAVATLLPVPKNVFSIAAGATFGPPAGVGLVLAGACLGAGVAFWIGRLLGRDAVERLTGGRLARVDAVLFRRGFVAVLGLRLVPLVPFTALNYAAGLSAVRWSHYIGATALGIVPGTVALVVLGAYGSTPASVPFVSAAVGLVALSAVGVWAVRRGDRMPSGDRAG
jgi:uncharacterized membrane protein YdjX (TVP38/TMEM64 family)